MSKYEIVALFGPAGSGKDYLLNKIMKTIWGKTHLNKIISCTTRPPREGEMDGVNYHFLSAADFFDKNKLIEFTKFRNWYYGTPESSLSEEKINIGVFNIAGINLMLDNPDCEVLPIRIYADDRTRLLRQFNRETNPDYMEICRRFITDKQDFAVVPFHYNGIENNTDEIQPVINETLDLIRHWTKKEKPSNKIFI